MSLLVEGTRAVYLGAQAQLLDADDNRELAWAERHVKKHPTIRHLLGRYVEADNANSNGHIFDLKELETAQHHIAQTPLNMLHRQSYIVGHYVAAELVYPTEAADQGKHNPCVEALAAFYRYYFPEEFREVEKAHAEGSLYFCVDDQTELLSADGWKRRSDLRVGEEILTLNTISGLSEWTALEAVNTYELAGEEVISMEGMMHSSVTTPNHRWWVERRAHRTRNEGSTWEWRTTETLTQETFIPRAVPHADFPTLAKYDDSFVEMAAWFWTEGTVPGSGSTVYQSHAKNPLNCDRIAACLYKLYGSPARVRDGGLWYSTDHDKMRHFHLCTEATKPFLEVGGKLPTAAFIRSLTESQLRLWVQTSLDGDGDNAASGQLGIKQNSLVAQRTFEMACALLGMPTNTNQCKDGQWRVGIIQRSNRFNPVREDQNRRYRHPVDGFEIERKSFSGTVWCPTTPNGTFLARRRGTVYWTGNSMECVPKSLTCSGTCGQEYAYDGRSSPTYCAHLNEPGAKRRLNEPNFTGGALIIPPIKPGWNRADITQVSALMAEHAEQADAMYKQVKTDLPHLEARQWEAMVIRLTMMAFVDVEGEHARDYSVEDRKKMAKKGYALPSGAYPIMTIEDLANAIQALSRAKPGEGPAVKQHITKRAAALGATKTLPAAWNVS